MQKKGKVKGFGKVYGRMTPVWTEHFRGVIVGTYKGNFNRVSHYEILPFTKLPKILPPEYLRHGGLILAPLATITEKEVIQNDSFRLYELLRKDERDTWTCDTKDSPNVFRSKNWKKIQVVGMDTDFNRSNPSMLYWKDERTSAPDQLLIPKNLRALELALY